ncbi:TolB protein [Paenibacillaceae bacterium GAS479]|nr:TolB protein [Paenibacillaceae bacterium GAS479]
MVKSLMKITSMPVQLFILNKFKPAPIWNLRIGAGCLRRGGIFLNKINIRSSALAISVTLLLIVSACGTASSAERQLVERLGKEITVIQSNAGALYKSGPVVDKTVQLGADFIGLDWTGEDSLIVSKRAKQMIGQVADEQKPPSYLYLRHLNKSQDSSPTLGMEEILKGNENFVYTQISPDKKHLFYIQQSENYVHRVGKIMNLETGGITEIKSDVGVIWEAAWTDKKSLLLMTGNGMIVRLDVTGKVSEVLETGEVNIPPSLVVSSNGSVYISHSSSTLFVYDPTASVFIKIMDNARLVAPSPDGNRLAIVKRISAAEEKLIFTDLNGKTEKTIGTSASINGISWSPDGQRLAYSVTSDAGTGNNGVFITNEQTTESTPLKLTNDSVSGLMKWSPSGKKLLINYEAYDKDSRTFQFNGTVVYFK